MAKILVVEDEHSVRQRIVEILTLEGHSVTEVANGALAIEKILIQKPDIILCDIVMPVMDGYAFYTWVRTNPETEKTPFAYLTAKKNPQDLEVGKNFMVDAYITKPFSVNELLNTVKSLIDKIN